MEPQFSFDSGMVCRSIGGVNIPRTVLEVASYRPNTSCCMDEGTPAPTNTGHVITAMCFKCHKALSSIGTATTVKRIYTKNSNELCGSFHCAESI
ncbi:AAEL002429-PA [Aedes aegypti]|uniref:AAEL002429-PA n=1 Tax=Aedes aegypti TaxID=7159 RepID=Q17I84_AEDAE|nr:AAEL002429-PA [Aedes aegypti]